MNSQGYNFSNGSPPTNGFNVSSVESTKKYIMNTKKLIGSRETSTLSEATRKPIFDPYRTPEHRLEYSLFGGEYYCATDVKIYIGDIWVDDVIAIGYSVTEQVVPVYGYASYTYDDIARGQRLVNGGLSINFKSAGYMQNVLKYADAIMYAIKVGENNGTVKPIDFENYKLNELLAKLGKRSFEQIAAEYEAALWGNSEDGEIELNHDLTTFFPNSNLGFDIRVHFGPVDEVMKDTGLDYYSNNYLLQEPEYTVEVINGVQFTTVGKQITTQDDSTPVLEMYSFIARDINGISKERFVAQLEFENMDEGGTMFGNATSSMIETPYSEILGFEKAEYSAEGIRVGETAKSIVQVKYVKNVSGDNANVYVSDWGKEINIRLIGVDAYNTDDSDPDKKKLAIEAQNYLKAMLTEGTTYSLEFEADTSNKVVTTSGSHNAYAIKDGENINVGLLRNGLAKMAYGGNGLDRHRGLLQKAEEEARLARKGIWAKLPHEPGQGLTDAELKAFFALNPSLTGGVTYEDWKKKN